MHYEHFISIIAINNLALNSKSSLTSLIGHFIRAADKFLPTADLGDRYLQKKEEGAEVEWFDGDGDDIML